MITITSAGLWVHDQAEALAFYTDKLGFEVREDVTVPELGNFRWLTVGPPNQPAMSISLLAIPEPPTFEPDTIETIHKLLAKGVASGLFLTTDDLDATYQELKGRGVEFTQEPTQVPYGYDAGIRDPSGNNMRILQVA